MTNTLAPRVTLRQALQGRSLLGSVLKGPSWLPWRTLLIASMGEALDQEERRTFTMLTGRAHEPNQRIEEFVGVIGRRGGKSRAISLIVTYLSALCEHPSLVPGETGVALVIAPDTKQAGIILDYCEANFRNSSILRQLIQNRTVDTLHLTNGIEICVRASNFRNLRGPTYIVVVLDEGAFLMVDDSSANPDTEILASIRPGLASTNGPCIIISSPYARKGELWRLYQKHYGPNGDPLILVAQADTLTMNQTLPRSVVERAYERDPASANAEYGAQFRSDIENFVSLEVVKACVSRGVYERPYDPSLAYESFVDPSGGSSDSMALVIGHQDFSRQTVIVDVLREATPPFSPEQVVEDFSKLLHQYHVTMIQSDKWGGVWPVEMFGHHNIICEQSARPKSELYRDCLPLLNSCRIQLLDHPKLIQQFTGLERRTQRGGRDSIDHAPGGHDDLCNVVAGLCSKLTEYGAYDVSMQWLDGPDKDGQQTDSRAWRAQQLASALNGIVNTMNMPRPWRGGF